MKAVLPILSLCVAASLAASESATSAKATTPTAALATDPKLTVEGVGLGATLATVKTALGVPEHETDEPHDRDADMGMGPGKTLQYEGLLIEMCKPEGQTDYHVWRITVTGAWRKLAVGVHVGVTRAVAVEALGEPESVSRDDEGDEFLHYTFRGFDGWYWLKIQNGKVTEIGMAEDWS